MYKQPTRPFFYLLVSKVYQTNPARRDISRALNRPGRPSPKPGSAIPAGLKKIKNRRGGRHDEGGVRGRYETGGLSYIVIAPKDEDGAGAPYTLAVGPVTEHFVNQASNLGTSLAYGMAASFGAAPPGYAIETVLTVATKGASPARAADRVSVPAGGVNDALFAYGDYVLKRHGKTRAAGDIRTETAYLGYSTTGTASPPPVGAAPRSLSHFPFF